MHVKLNALQHNMTFRTKIEETQAKELDEASTEKERIVKAAKVINN